MPVPRARKTMSSVLVRQTTLHPLVGRSPLSEKVATMLTWDLVVTFYREKYCLQRAPVFLVFYVFTAAIMHVTSCERSTTCVLDH